MGSHSYDRSYAEVESLEFHGLHLRLRWGQTAEGQLIWAATPLNTSTAAASDFVLKFEGSYTWMRAGSVSTSGTFTSLARHCTRRAGAGSALTTSRDPCNPLCGTTLTRTYTP